jgi:peptidoglycan/LPS O-acetylase OafA/YrhL
MHPRAAPMPHLKVLTSLRFFAALAVVFDHLTNDWHTGPIPEGSTGSFLRRAELLATNLLTWGSVAVSLFFVLSGFILTYTYFDARGRRHGTLYTYYLARIARIYPIYVLAVFFAVVPAYLWHYQSRAHILASLLSHLTLLEAWFPTLATQLNVPLWSLSVEALFYALLPFLVVPLLRLRPGALLLACAGFWLVTITPPLVGLALHGIASGNEVGNYWVAAVYVFPPYRLAEFLIGACVCRLYLWRAEMGRQWWEPTLGPALLLFACALFATWHTPWVLHAHGLIDLFAALVIYAGARGGGWLAGPLSTRPAVLLGEASYALYLFHYPLWWWLDHVHPAPLGGTAEARLYALLYLLLATALSVAIYWYIERPARTLIRHLGARQQQTSSAAQAKRPVLSRLHG